MDAQAENSKKGDLGQTSPKKQNPGKETSSESKPILFPLHHIACLLRLFKTTLSPNREVNTFYFDYTSKICLILDFLPMTLLLTTIISLLCFSSTPLMHLPASALAHPHFLAHPHSQSAQSTEQRERLF